MKRELTLLFCAAAILVTPLHAEYRTWANTEGVKIDAEMVKVEGDAVTLRMRNGKLSTFPQAKLSDADREFIQANKDAIVSPEIKTSVDANRKARWLTRMDKAQKESTETGLPILVLFTGTSWCPYCIKLEKSVFSEKEFKTFADQNLVLLKLDFGPGGSSRSRDDKKLQNDFGVSGFPTYFLTDATGKKLSQGGYHDGINPAGFGEWVNKSAPKK